MFLTKTRLLEQENNVPTKEGLIVELDVALLYHISPDKARDIYVDLGENYEVGAGIRFYYLPPTLSAMPEVPTLLPLR